MSRSSMNSAGAISLFVFVGSLLATVWCALPQEFIDSTDAIIDTLRKRECVVALSIPNQSVAGKTITVRQLRNHFGFGASIGKKWFTKTDSAKYAEAFSTYFDWATPENEMKWDVSEELDDYQDYQDADWLIDWCTQHNIKVRGHNLFWNEKREWMPDWSLELDTAGFKAAMKRRIDGAMTHFKGKVAHWDLINEIVHGESGQIERPGLLATLSGDPEIFSWIFKEARAIDENALLGVNEYNIIGQYSAANEYVTEIKDIEGKGGKIDIVGLEGHLGGYVERSRYLERIDTMAAALPAHSLWLTEVDFLVDLLVRADKMEELMRTCFAHPHVGGIVLWIWWQGNRWRDLNSFLIDSNYTENELGYRWRTVRDSWKTTASGTVNENGQFSFKGFQGQYVAQVLLGDSMYCDTFELEPGQGVHTVTIVPAFSVGVQERKIADGASVGYKVNGIPVAFRLPREGAPQVFLSSYTLSGKLLAKIPLSIKNGTITTPLKLPPGCRVVRIGTDKQTLYTGMEVQAR